MAETEIFEHPVANLPQNERIFKLPVARALLDKHGKLLVHRDKLAEYGDTGWGFSYTVIADLTPDEEAALTDRGAHIIGPKGDARNIWFTSWEDSEQDQNWVTLGIWLNSAFQIELNRARDIIVGFNTDGDELNSDEDNHPLYRSLVVVDGYTQFLTEDFLSEIE